MIEGVTLDNIGMIGTGKSSGSTDGGVYVQGFNHFSLRNSLITDFGQDGLHTDRLYYNLAPDAALDDRGAFVSLEDSEISSCGRTNYQGGGLNSANDYSTDHLYTKNMHIVTAGVTGAKIYTNNWVDNCSLFQGDAIGLHLLALNTDILTQGITSNSTRFEGGETDCMLKIDSCRSAIFNNPFFIIIHTCSTFINMY